MDTNVRDAQRDLILHRGKEGAQYLCEVHGGSPPMPTFCGVRIDQLDQEELVAACIYMHAELIRQENESRREAKTD